MNNEYSRLCDYALIVFVVVGCLVALYIAPFMSLTVGVIISLYVGISHGLTKLIYKKSEDTYVIGLKEEILLDAVSFIMSIGIVYSLLSFIVQ